MTYFKMFLKLLQVSSSIHFRTVTNALDQIIVSGKFILSDLLLPIIRHARSCRALDLLIKVYALVRCKIPQYIRISITIDLHSMEQASAVMYALNLQSSLNLLLAFLWLSSKCKFIFRLGSMIQPRFLYFDVKFTVLSPKLIFRTDGC